MRVKIKEGLYIVLPATLTAEQVKERVERFNSRLDSAERQFKRSIGVWIK